MTKENNAKTGIGATGNTGREQTGGSDREPAAKGRSYPTGGSHDPAAGGTPRAFLSGAPLNGSREEPSLAFMLSLRRLERDARGRIAYRLRGPVGSEWGRPKRGARDGLENRVRDF